MSLTFPQLTQSPWGRAPRGSSLYPPHPPCTLDISCVTLGKLLIVHCVLKMGTCRLYRWRVVRTKRPCLWKAWHLGRCPSVGAHTSEWRGWVQHTRKALKSQEQCPGGRRPTAWPPDALVVLCLPEDGAWGAAGTPFPGPQLQTLAGRAVRPWPARRSRGDWQGAHLCKGWRSAQPTGPPPMVCSVQEASLAPWVQCAVCGVEVMARLATLGKWVAGTVG